MEGLTDCVDEQSSRNKTDFKILQWNAEGSSMAKTELTRTVHDRKTN